jgi:hypothetical protein
VLIIFVIIACILPLVRFSFIFHGRSKCGVFLSISSVLVNPREISLLSLGFMDGSLFSEAWGVPAEFIEGLRFAGD